MRLHLNRTLRAALIAAVSVVGYTITSAQAVTISATETWIVPRSGSEVSGTALSLTGISCDVAQKSGDVATNNVFAPDTNVGTGGTWTLTFSIKNTTDHAVTLNSLLLDVSMYNASGSAQNSNTIRTVDFTLQGDGVNDHEDILLQGKGNVATPVTIANSTEKPVLSFGEGGVTLASNGSQQFSLTVVRGSNQTAEYRNGCFYGLIDMVANFTYEGVIPTWKGGEHTTWSDAEAWSGGVPTASLPAIFDNTGTTSTVVINSAAQAASVSVSGKEYTFDLSEGGSLTTGTLSIADGAKLTVNGEGRTMAIGALSNEGELAIGTGATVSMGADVTLDASHTLNVTGDGTLAIQKLTVSGGDHTLGVGLNMTDIALNGGTVTFASGTSTVSGKIYSNSDSTTLVVGAETGTAVLKANRVELGDTNNTSKHHDLTINAGGTLKITGENTGTDYKSASLVLGEWNVTPTTVTVKGLLIADKVAATAGDSGYVMNINGGTALLKGLQRKDNNRKQELNITNNGSLILGATGIVGANTGDNVSLTVNNGTIGVYADSVTIDKAIALTGDVTFDTQKYTVNDITITRGETGGTLTVSGNITGNGTITKTGAGELILSGGANALGNTIQAQGGTLTLSGVFEIGGIAPTDGESTYRGGQNTKNGYETARGNIVVYTGEGVTTTGGSFTYHGESVKLDNGSYALPGEEDTTTFYINEGTESYSWIDGNKTEDFSNIVVKQAGTLQVNKDINMSLVSAESSGTVQIDSGYVATSDGTVKNVALAGDGTYALGDNNITMTATLGDDWSGTVRLGGFAFNNDHTHSLTPFWKGSSVVEMCGITGGYLEGWNQGTESANIRLTNPGDDGIAWVWSDGTSGTSDPTITFTGKWEGEGTFKLSNLRENITFAGDISEWYGTFDYHGNHGTTLTFTENAKEINATILNNGVNNATNTQKQFHLIVRNEAEFGKDVAAYTLEVAVGASATFQGDATFNSLSGTGKVALDKDAKLTVSGTVADTVTIDAADGAVIDAELAPTQVGIAADATATFMQGIQDASGVEFLGEEGVQVKNTNDPVGGSAINYSVGETAAKVTADVLFATNTEAVVVNNALIEVGSITHMGTEALTLTKVDEDALKVVSTDSADLTIKGITETSLTDLSIGTGATVAVYTDTQATLEGTVTITDTLTAGGGTLKANLTLMGDSTLDLSLMDGGMEALTLGSTLTINTETGLINLDDATLAALDALDLGERLTLVKALDQTTLAYGQDGGYTDTWYGQMFNREGEQYSLIGDFQVFSTEQGFGLTKVSNVPEPTTGTLSLLALAALAARRRRK